ncbi:hypothetical protein [Pseudonocardia sp.]|uniref:hypothetical protein n=1 Tax=Pseudonocardia sp. TaxID=60912 RepID=UPI00262A05ED|nr:hypothetical protein [Pseudonocardia sp.]
MAAAINASIPPASAAVVALLMSEPVELLAVLPPDPQAVRANAATAAIATPFIVLRIAVLNPSSAPEREAERSGSPDRVAAARSCHRVLTMGVQEWPRGHEHLPNAMWNPQQQVRFGPFGVG